MLMSDFTSEKIDDSLTRTREKTNALMPLFCRIDSVLYHENDLIRNKLHINIE